MPTYAVRAPLARWLGAEAARAGADLGPYRLLDVGCGEMPYLTLFQPHVREVVGMDTWDNPRASLRGVIESIPADDASFDVVLCAQVLEHVDDPAQGIRELARVTRPGGRVLLSTHGAMVYHPNPVDLWRWTGAGLDRLFRTNGLGFRYGVRRLRHCLLPRDAERDLPRARSPADTASRRSRADRRLAQPRRAGARPARGAAP